MLVIKSLIVNKQMNRIILIFISLVVNSLNLSCQTFECALYYEKYCESLHSDTLNLPNYLGGFVYLDKDTGSSKTVIPDCIYDLDAFCFGVKEALESNILSIRQIGEISHVTPCEYYSYEKYGVALIMTGDIVTDRGIFDENAGFNYIMKKRIKEKLGDKVYNSIGKEESSWLNFDEMLVKNLFSAIKLESYTDSTILIKIDTLELAKTKFEHLDGVVFQDSRKEELYSINDLLRGIELMTKNKRAFLTINFENYTNPRFCKSHFNSTWNVPIFIKE